MRALLSLIFLTTSLYAHATLVRVTVRHPNTSAPGDAIAESRLPELERIFNDRAVVDGDARFAFTAWYRLTVTESNGTTTDWAYDGRGLLTVPGMHAREVYSLIPADLARFHALLDMPSMRAPVLDGPTAAGAVVVRPIDRLQDATTLADAERGNVQRIWAERFIAVGVEREALDIRYAVDFGGQRWHYDPAGLFVRLSMFRQPVYAVPPVRLESLNAMLGVATSPESSPAMTMARTLIRDAVFARLPAEETMEHARQWRYEQGTVLRQYLRNEYGDDEPGSYDILNALLELSRFRHALSREELRTAFLLAVAGVGTFGIELPGVNDRFAMLAAFGAAPGSPEIRAEALSLLHLDRFYRSEQAMVRTYLTQRWYAERSPALRAIIEARLGGRPDRGYGAAVDCVLSVGLSGLRSVGRFFSHLVGR